MYANPNGTATLETVLNSPSLFPFNLRAISADSLVAVSEQLTMLRHGLDQELLMLNRRMKK